MLLYYKLQKTFEGTITLQKEKGVYEAAKQKGAVGQDPKEPLDEIIEKINEKYKGAFTEGDRVLLNALHAKLMANKKLANMAKTSDPQIFAESIFPKAFGDAAQDSYMEAQAAEMLKEWKVPFVINQNCYSIFDRTIEHNGLKETAARLGKGIIAFSPLAQGLLTDRYLKGIPADSRIMTDGRFLKETALTEQRMNQIRALNDLAAQRGQTLAQMALAWVLRDGVVASVLAGASRPEQILDNIKAAENTNFTADELALIEKITAERC